MIIKIHLKSYLITLTLFEVTIISSQFIDIFLKLFIDNFSINYT